MVYDVKILLKNLRDLERTEKYKIHNIDLFSKDLNCIIKGLELLVEKETI